MEVPTDPSSLVVQVSSNIGFLPFDLLVIGVIFVIVFLYAFFFGKSRSTTFLLSIYLAGFISLFFPLWDSIKGLTEGNSFVLEIGVFVVITIIAWLSIRASIYSAFPEGVLEKVFQASLLSISTTVLLLFYGYHVIPIKDSYTFSPSLENILSSPVLFFWALLIPIAVLYFLGRSEY